MTGPRLLVTGAAGRLGRAVASTLHEAGHDLLGTDVVDAPDVEYPFESADLRDHERALELLEGVDVLLHFGNHPGIGSRPPQVVFNDNVTINHNVFQGAAERGVSRIVFASTLQLVGSHVDERTVVTAPRPPSYPLDETMTPDPSNVYALSKHVSEVMLRYYAERCGLSCIAVRFPLLHAGEERVRVAAGEERPVDVMEAFSGMVHADAAGLVATLAVTDLPGYRVYQPGSAHRHRDLSVPELIARYYPDVAPDTPDLVDATTITRETGWRPRHAHPWGPPAAGSPTPTDPPKH